MLCYYTTGDQGGFLYLGILPLLTFVVLHQGSALDDQSGGHRHGAIGSQPQDVRI